MRIALFVTCFGDTFFPSTGRAVVRVLERLGHEVVFTAGQTCCGHYADLRVMPTSSREAFVGAGRALVGSALSERFEEGEHGVGGLSAAGRAAWPGCRPMDRR